MKRVLPSDVLDAAREYAIARTVFVTLCDQHVREHADHVCAPKPVRHPLCTARANALRVLVDRKRELLELASKYSEP